MISYIFLSEENDVVVVTEGEITAVLLNLKRRVFVNLRTLVRLK